MAPTASTKSSMIHRETKRPPEATILIALLPLTRVFHRTSLTGQFLRQDLYTPAEAVSSLAPVPSLPAAIAPKTAVQSLSLCSHQAASAAKKASRPLAVWVALPSEPVPRHSLP